MAKRQDGGISVLSATEEDILSILIGEAHGVYGLDILHRINKANQKSGRREIGVGSLYPALKRMEKEGLIKGRWGDEKTPEEESGGARRRYYSISRVGENSLRATWNYREELLPLVQRPVAE